MKEVILTMRILIASNGSLQTDKMTHFIAQIARRSDEIPTLLDVIKNSTKRSFNKPSELLIRIHKLLGISDLQIKTRIGDPIDEIIRETQEGNYDLVVVGVQKSAHLSRLLTGSRDLLIAERAPCSVLIAKGEMRPIHRILLCASGAEKSPTLVRFTANLTQLLKGDEEVTVLHVMSQISAGPGVRGIQLRSNAETLIQEKTPEGDLLVRNIQLLKQSGISPQPKIRHGIVVDEILDEARNGNYDLVVIGSHQEDGWRSVLLDDLARKIIAQIDRPVLVVK
jgi:nucleotide-binding universal stress UspA family protein